MAKVALLVEMKAKPGKEEELAAFLAGAQPMAVAEPGTLTWFVLRLDAQTFVLCDTFRDDDARRAHLKGAISAALMGRADELLAGPLGVRKADVLAAKLP